MSHLLFDISKTVLIVVLVMHLVVWDEKSMLFHVTGLLYYSTWVGIVQEIFQHKLKYFGNICCLVFVMWVAQRINRHGRPRPASKTWRHVSIKQPITSQDNKSVIIDAYVSYEVVTDDRPVGNQGFDKQLTAVPCSTEHGKRSAVIAREARSVDGDEQVQGDAPSTAVVMVDRVLKPVECEDSGSSSVVQSAFDEQIDSQLGSFVDVIDDESKSVAAVPVRLTRNRILATASFLGLGGFLCWRFLKK